MKIAVASGKGGTGKTTVALNLARAVDGPVQLLDCDVEEPNCHLFLKGELLRREPVSIPVPQVDETLCDFCNECGRFCRFHAIIAIKSAPLVFGELCHGCGGCARVCPRKAIQEVERPVGAVETLRAGPITLIQGRLDVGAPLSPPVIRAVKARLREGTPAILDAPPGTSCPVIAAVRGADLVVLVTEPTPFGLHDLTLAVEVMEEIGLPFGVVVNRMGAGDDRVHRYCAERRVPIIAEIPDDRRIAEAYSRGELISDALPEFRALFERLLLSIEKSSAKKAS